MKKIIIFVFCINLFSNELSKLAYDCDFSDYNACSELAHKLLKLENYKDYLENSNYLLKKACNNNISQACHSLSLANFNARGIEKNTKEGIKLANKACDLGYFQSCVNLGNIYKFALANENINTNMAFKYYEKACDNGLYEACYQIATIWQYTEPNNKKTNNILKYHKKACDNGFSHSCYHLGYFYYFAKYVKQDYKKSYEYLKKSCDLNNDFACLLLGNMYEYAKGVKKDISKALESYKKSCQNRNFTACNNYERLKKE